jgi:hypothetical protein
MPEATPVYGYLECLVKDLPDQSRMVRWNFGHRFWHVSRKDNSMNTSSHVATDASASNQDSRARNEQELPAIARKGTDWFFWTAGLSVINVITSIVIGMPNYVFGVANGRFVGGMAIGIAQIFGVANWGMGVLLITQSFDLPFAGLFIAAGILARKQYRWVVKAGLVLYAVDCVIFIIFANWIGVAIHVVALWRLWIGLQALSGLRDLKKQSATPNQ